MVIVRVRNSDFRYSNEDMFGLNFSTRGTWLCASIIDVFQGAILLAFLETLTCPPFSDLDDPCRRRSFSLKTGLQSR